MRGPELQPSGTQHLDEVNLPLEGSWLVEVEVRVGDFELAKLRGTLDVRP